jgi:asparagine synthase (glutamine-hydrolysing)
MKSIQAQPEAYLQAFFHVRSEDLDSPFFSHLPRWRLTEKTKLFFSPRVRNAIERAGPSHAQDRLAAALPEAFDSWGHFAQAQYLESVLLLPGYILSSQGDRMTMGNSVEGRFPFLDHHLVELAARLPAHTKMKVLDEKHVLKRAAEGLVPESVLRRPKQPYRAPDAISFFDRDKQCARFEYVDELLSEAALEKTDLFSPAPVQKLVAKAKSGRVVGVQDNMALVGILSTQLACHALLEM